MICQCFVSNHTFPDYCTQIDLFLFFSVCNSDTLANYLLLTMHSNSNKGYIISFSTYSSGIE